MIDEALVVLYIIGTGTWTMWAVAAIGQRWQAFAMFIIAAFAVVFTIVWRMILAEYGYNHFIFKWTIPVEIAVMFALALFLRELEYRAIFGGEPAPEPEIDARRDSPSDIHHQRAATPKYNYVPPEPTQPRAKSFTPKRSWLNVKLARMERKHKSKTKKVNK